MRQLINTDMGYLSAENVRYLIKQHILIKNTDPHKHALSCDYVTRYEWRDGISALNVISWIMQDIEGTTGIRDTDDQITVMRKGFKNRYPAVHDAWSYWTIAKTNHQNRIGFKGRTKKRL